MFGTTVATALLLLPSVSCWAVYMDQHGNDRGLQELPFEGDVFLSRGDGDNFPGTTFVEDTKEEANWNVRGSTWQTTPRMSRHYGEMGKAKGKGKGKGSGKAKGSTWEWKDEEPYAENPEAPCIPADEYYGDGSKGKGKGKGSKKSFGYGHYGYILAKGAKSSKKSSGKYNICPDSSPAPGGDGPTGPGGGYPPTSPGGGNGPTSPGGGYPPTSPGGGNGPTSPGGGNGPTSPGGGNGPTSPGGGGGSIAPGGGTNSPGGSGTNAPGGSGPSSPSGSGTIAPGPWGSGKGSSDDVDDPGSDVCEAVEAQSEPDNLSSEQVDNFVAVLDITYDRDTGVAYTSSSVITVLESILPIISLWIAGCETRAYELASQISRRRLQDTGPADYVEAEVDSDYSETGRCDENNDPTCTDEFRLDFNVFHDNTVGKEVWSNRIEEAFSVFGYLIDGRSGLDFDSDSDVSVQDDRGFDGAEGGPPPVEDDSVNVAAVIGASAGGLALILLIVLLVRRRQAEDEISHLKLEEDGAGDDTFIRELETTASSPSRDEGYESRNVHVVGEADSIYSGWTGYTPHEHDENEMANNETGDVHKCSSATCEVCERRRQQGIQFIPTGSPARPQIPSDASREYMADDTVEL